MTTTRLTSTWRIAVARTLLVLTAWLSLAPALHSGNHDQDCDPAILLHDAAQHRVTASTSGQADHPSDHCVACHLFRSSRHLGAWRFVPQTPAEQGLSTPIDGNALIARAAIPLPARAPPSLA